MKVNTCVMIHFACRNQIKLVEWDYPAALVKDIKSGSGEEVVIDLLRRATVFKDKRNRNIAVRRWCWR
jgi:hypothetical protein